jgi:hypothetical protein
MYRPGRIRTDRWYDVAVICRDRPQTVPAIAGKMGVPSGSIQSVVDTMQKEGLLSPTDSAARGAALGLTQRGKRELHKAETADKVEPLLLSGERLVLVTEDGHGLIPDALAQLAADPSFQWAARIDGPVKWIASFGSGDAAAADRAATAIAGAGGRAVVGRADAFFNRDSLAEYAARLSKSPRKAIAK